MAVTPTSLDNGSTTPTVGNGWSTLGTSGRTTDAVVVLHVDLSAMVYGDTIQIAVREEVQTDAATARRQIIFEATGLQTAENELWHSEAVGVMHGWDFQIRQLTGTARAFTWKIVQV